MEKAAATAADATRRAAEHTAQAVRTVLEDPRLRERIPGRSLTLLGAGLVALAVLLSALPFFPGIGPAWSLVMLAGSVLIGARELHAAGRSLPEPVVRAARVTEHPLFLPAFTVLTCVHAFLTFGVGLVSLVWLLAAVVLGYDQRRALAATLEGQSTPSPEARSLGRWVLLGSLVCALSLFSSWGYHGGYYLGGMEPVEVQTYSQDGFLPTIEDKHYEYRYNMWSNLVPLRESSGRGRPFAVGVVLALGGLVMLTRRRHPSVPPWVLPVLAAGVTIWGLSGLSSYRGPWAFLMGALVIDFAVARDFLRHQRPSV